MTITQRKRFQISALGTLVLALIAGVIVGANVVPRQGEPIVSPERELKNGTIRHRRIVWMTGRGWPLMFQEWYQDEYDARHHFEWAALALNVFLALIVLTLTWLALEWRKLPVMDERK